ncbi:hypothetical protein ACR6HW_08440 [Fusibacter sp. JL298sf-3]
MKKTISTAYERYDNAADFNSYAAKVIEGAKAQKMPIEEDENRVAKGLKGDLREALPAQLYAIIGAVATCVEQMEGERSRKDESQQDL